MGVPGGPPAGSDPAMTSLSALATAPRLAPRLALAAWVVGLALALVQLHDAAMDGTARALEAGLARGSSGAVAAPDPSPGSGGAASGDLAERPGVERTGRD